MILSDKKINWCEDEGRHNHERTLMQPWPEKVEYGKQEEEPCE